MNTYGKQQQQQQWRRSGPIRHRRRSLAPVMVLLSAAAAALYLCPPAGVWAQAQQQQTPQAQQQTPPNQIPAQTPPDVQIIVMPDPVSAQWAVATVYPKKVPRAEADARQKQLLTLTGWKVAGKPEFEDRALERVDNPAGMEKPPVMSSLTFQTASPVVDWADGTLTVEPFARAFRDLDRIHITYLLPPGFRFRGLTDYRDNNIDVTFSGSQNAYTYILAIKNHELGELKLPRYGTDGAASGAASASDGKGAGSGTAFLRRVLGISLVVLAAIAAGLTAYLIISRSRGSSSSRRGA